MRKFFWIILVLLLSGCRATQMEGRSFVSTVGIEKYDDYNISLGYIEPEGDNIYSAKELKVESETPYFTDEIMSLSKKQLYTGHIKTLILDKSVFKDKEYIREVLYAFADNNLISMDVSLMVSDDEDIVEKLCNSSDGLYIRDFYRNNGNNMPMSFRLSIADALKIMDTSDCVVVPFIEGVDERIVIKNAVVISDNGFKKLSESEFNGYKYFMEDIKSLNKIVETKDGKEVFEIVEVKNKIDFKEENRRIKVILKSDAYVKNISAPQDKSDFTVLEEKITEELTSAGQIIKDYDIWGLEEMIKRRKNKIYHRFSGEVCDNIDFEWDINIKSAV